MCWLTKDLCGSGFLADANDAQALKELPHLVIHFIAELFSHTNMVGKRSSEVAQHRVVFRRQGHEVSGVGRHNLIDAPVEVIERNIHVQRSADVESDSVSVQLAHHEVFQAAAHKLFFGAENFGANETGNVVEKHPRFCIGQVDLIGWAHLLVLSHTNLQCPQEAVFARLVHHHVETCTVAVSSIGALARFCIQSKTVVAPRIGMRLHFFDGDIKCLIGRNGAGQTLKPNARGIGLHAFDTRLNVDMR